MRRSRSVNEDLGRSHGILKFLLHGVDALLSIQASLDNIIGEHELIELLLQVIVLEGKDIGMVLKGTQFLFETMTCFKQLLIA